MSKSRSSSPLSDYLGLVAEKILGTMSVLYTAAIALLTLQSQNFRLSTYSRVIENDGSALSTLELTNNLVLSIEKLEV
ncbi:hypothetical protein ACROYT_G033744 [Oculina patagonica]